MYRSGSAVELVGLSMSAVTWLEKLSAEKVYPYDGVSAFKNGKENFIRHYTISYVNFPLVFVAASACI